MSTDMSSAFFDGAFADEEFTASATSAASTFKVKILGSKGVGKSALLVNSTKGYWKEDKHSQRVVPDSDTKSRAIELAGERFDVEISDMKTSDKAHNRSLGDAEGIVLVYDVTSLDSYDKVSGWARQITRYANENAVVVLVGNKADLTSEKVVDTVTARNYAESKGWLFYEVSAKQSVAVDECLHNLVSTMQRTKTQTSRQSNKFKKSKCTLQ